MTTTNRDAAVVVVGAGPVGLLNALGLARRGIPVIVLERHESVVRAPRAVVYHWATLEGLDRLGVLEPAVRAGFLKQDYCFWNWRTGEQVRYGLSVLDGQVAHPYNLHLGQDRLVDVILRIIADEALPVEVRWGREVIGLRNLEDRAVVTARRADGSPERFTADWVLGADGAGSAVRTLLGMPFEGFTWPERFVATDVVYPFEEEGYNQTTFLVDEVFGAIIVKIDNSDRGGLWRYTYSEPAELPADGVRDRMDGFFGTVLPRADRRSLAAYSPYKMHQRCAGAFRTNRVLLAGDAAHATNPTGGLGLTSGLFDTYYLVEALAGVVHGTLDDWVLDHYAHERRRVFKESVSPAATANKQLVFGSTETEAGSAAWERVRRLATDAEAARARLLFPQSLETPLPVG
ncbi:FAD-dependent monooxygenase [Nocardia sp. NPDC050697]|uniref:FAD-dependent oxidoreductase n=1 Tax=Nocardia sp. NPDC050697 TaxID=3155158 RepID=UPI0033E1E683